MESEGYDLVGGLRFKGCLEYPVGGEGFLWGGAAEMISEEAGALHEEGGPHLLDDIGEARLEDAAGDGLEGGGKSEVGAFPVLFFSTLEEEEGLGICGGEADATVGAEDLDESGIGGTGGEPFHFEADGCGVAVDVCPAVEEGIVPSIA